MKSQNIPIIIGLAIFTVFFITVAKRVFIQESFECHNNRLLRNKKFQGIVVDIKYNIQNHNNEIIALNNGYIYEWHDENYDNFLTKNIQVGDSVKKEIGTLLLDIYKKDTLLNFNMGYDCLED